MGKLLKLLMSSTWLLIGIALIVQSANAQKRYPSIDDAWDATDYRALVERVETGSLDLPRLSGGDTKSVFERMVAADNIPLRVGQNEKLSATVRYQKLQPVLKPLHQLITLYLSEAQKGKPYATELAMLKVYETKASSTLLNIHKPYLATFEQDERYHVHVGLLDKMKDSARELYSELLQSMTETNLYSRSDILVMVEGAINALPAYHPIFTDQDRKDHTNSLAKQISATNDQQLKTALTELHDAIKNGRIRT